MDAALSRRRLELGLLAYSVLAPAAAAALFARGYSGLEDAPFGRLLLWQAPGYLSWMVVVPLIAWILASRSTVGSLAAYAALGVPVILAHAWASAWWLARAHPLGPRPHEAAGFGWFVHRVPIDLLVYSFIGAALFARQYAFRYADERARTARLGKDLVGAQLDALRARLQPHFLFNALQSIAVLIKRDPDSAVRMTRDLAGVLRLTLQRDGAALVPLEAELELVERYLAVEQVRFSDRLRASYAIDAAARVCLVPDLLLQPIVENAVRHGLGPSGGGSVGVRAWVEGGRLHLEVSDDGAGPPEQPREGIGLGVTRSRLEGLFPGQQALALRRETGRTVVHIEIPAVPRPGGGAAS